MITDFGLYCRQMSQICKPGHAFDKGRVFDNESKRCGEAPFGIVINAMQNDAPAGRPKEAAYALQQHAFPGAIDANDARNPIGRKKGLNIFQYVRFPDV